MRCDSFEKHSAQIECKQRQRTVVVNLETTQQVRVLAGRIETLHSRYRRAVASANEKFLRRRITVRRSSKRISKVVDRHTQSILEKLLGEDEFVLKSTGIETAYGRMIHSVRAKRYAGPLHGSDLLPAQHAVLEEFNWRPQTAFELGAPTLARRVRYRTKIADDFPCGSEPVGRSGERKPTQAIYL